MLQALLTSRVWAWTPREGALLEYADRLTLTPAGVRAADLQPLRDAGLEDRAIHDACAIVAYFAFVNRIADGLGVELEGTGPENDKPEER